MSYSKISLNVAKYISHETECDNEKQQVIAYAVEGLLLTIGGFVLIVFVGAVFGAAFPAAVTAFAGGSLRRFSGGVHAETPLKCMLFSSLGYGLAASAGNYLSKLVVIDNTYLILTLVFCLLLVAYYAPVDCPAKPIHSTVLRKRLKIGSICFVVLIIALVIILDSASIKLALILGVFLQSLTLLPLFNNQRRR
ncbi:MAG: accessory gene regulator AgrB [Dehalobacterium sp.]